MTFCYLQGISYDDIDFLDHWRGTSQRNKVLKNNICVQAVQRPVFIQKNILKTGIEKKREKVLLFISHCKKRTDNRKFSVLS